MPDYDPIASIRHALDLVRADGAFEIIEDLRELGTGDLQFRCRVRVAPQPNPENLPEIANLRVVVDTAFPLTSVEVYVENPSIQGFPHQDAETGKLCLLPDRNAPYDISRLKVYLDWSRQWLSDAATGVLLRLGDPFELPDFSRRNFAEKLATDKPLLFDEDRETYPRWRERVGQTGRAEIAPSPSIRGLLIRRFYAPKGGFVRERSYSEDVADPKRRAFGRWILLPHLFFYRNRPPQTFGELREMVERVGINLLDVFRKCWEENNEDPELSFLLVGCPIPNRVGSEPSEVHWQPLFFSGRKDAARKYEIKYGRIKSGPLWNILMNDAAFADNNALPWGRSENISVGRLYARGWHQGIVRNGPIVLAGCGALGSVVAELIARGGLPRLTLFDPDRFEMGNQCRHTLDGSDLGLNKAHALARRLQLSNPLSTIKGIGIQLPIVSSLDKEIRRDAVSSIDSAKLIIDCTTDEGAFRWMNEIAVRNHVRLTSMFVNFRAQILTLLISGRTTSCKKVGRKLYRDIRDGKTPVALTDYDAAPDADDMVLPGAGCWHPTFPAANAHLWILASAATEMLNTILNEPPSSDGFGILIRRNADIGRGTSTGMIDVIWNRHYR